MAHSPTIISRVVVCLLTAAAVISIGAAEPHDVSPGMNIKHALMVAKRCVIEASSFNDPRKKEFHKELRAQDTLEYAGITDAPRLNALRRYIVRNIDIGVQSIWGVRLNEHYARPYLLPNSALAGIQKKWTLEELAREISKQSGLPFMTHARAAKVLADCRYKVVGNQKKPSLDDNIKGDIAPKPVSELRNCLVTNDERGIPSSGVTDAEGDFYPYVATYLESKVDEILVKDTATYRELVTLFHDHARVDLSAELSALTIVGNWLVEAKAAPASLSFPIAAICPQNKCAKDKTFDGNALSEFGIPDLSAVRRPRVLRTFRKDEESDSADVPELSSVTLLDHKTVRDLIDEVKVKLEAK